MDEVRDSYKEIMLACYYAVYKPSKIAKDYCSYTQDLIERFYKTNLHLPWISGERLVW